MIIKDSVSNATIIGDVQSNSVSVDIQNVDFIAQLLTTNLYSNPLESFLREIVSNAWDSHIEVGNTDPILLEIGTNTEGRDYIRIQDFGVGLSPDRFNNIYRMIGSSSKREDNKQIGGFGIGRFSALAYSDSVYITSNYSGIKYKYLMYKDGSKIKIDELYNAPTTDPNGLEVLVYLHGSSDIYDVKNAIHNQLAYFDNLYVSTDRYTNHCPADLAEGFNKLKIKRYKNFSVNTLSRSNDISILLGKIQYPLNRHIQYDTIYNFNKVYPIALNFEIGDLPVTPNREQIQYTQEAIDKISKKLDEAALEIESIINNETVKDYDDLYEYINFRVNGKTIITLLDTDELYNFPVNIIVKDNSIPVTFKGEKYDDNIISLWNHIMNNSTNRDPIYLKNEHVSFKISDGRMMIKDPLPWNTSLASLILNIIHDVDTSEELSDKIYICNRGNLKAVSKNYLRETARHNTIFIKESIKFKDIIKKVVANSKYNTSSSIYDKFKHKWVTKEARLILSYIGENLSKIKTFSDSDVPQAYIDADKKRVAATRGTIDSINWNEELNLFRLRERQTYTSDLMVTADSKRYTFNSIKSGWKGKVVIYSYKDDIRLRRLFWTFHNIPHNRYGDYNKKHPFTNYEFVEIAPSKIHLLKPFPNFINIDDFMNVKYKKLREIGTAKYLNDNYGFVKALSDNEHMLLEISEKLANVSTKINNYIYQNLPNRYEKRDTLINEIYQMCEDHNYFDEEMMGYVKEHDKLLQNSKFITILANGSTLPHGMINFTVDYILKNKLFMPNLEAVKKLREETIFNIKKEKV